MFGSTSAASPSSKRTATMRRNILPHDQNTMIHHDGVLLLQTAVPTTGGAPAAPHVESHDVRSTNGPSSSSLFPSEAYIAIGLFLQMIVLCSEIAVAVILSSCQLHDPAAAAPAAVDTTNQAAPEQQLQQENQLGGNNNNADDSSFWMFALETCLANLDNAAYFIISCLLLWIGQGSSSSSTTTTASKSQKSSLASLSSSSSSWRRKLVLYKIVSVLYGLSLGSLLRYFIGILHSTRPVAAATTRFTIHFIGIQMVPSLLQFEPNHFILLVLACNFALGWYFVRNNDWDDDDDDDDDDVRAAVVYTSNNHKRRRYCKSSRSELEKGLLDKNDSGD